MRQEKALKQFVGIADVHAERIEMAIKHLDNILPLTLEVLDKVSDENLGFLELVSSRFAKLQDLIGGKIFSLTLDVLQENTQNLTVIDRLHKLEKLALIDDTKEWVHMRNIRNMIAHEYPDDPDIMLKNLNQIIKEAVVLVKFWKTLRSKIIKILNQLAAR